MFEFGKRNAYKTISFEIKEMSCNCCDKGLNVVFIWPSSGKEIWFCYQMSKVIPPVHECLHVLQDDFLVMVMPFLHRETVFNRN